MAKLKISVKDLEKAKTNSGKTYIMNIISEAMTKAGFPIEMRGSVMESDGKTAEILFAKDYMVIESGIDGLRNYDKKGNVKKK